MCTAPKQASQVRSCPQFDRVLNNDMQQEQQAALSRLAACRIVPSSTLLQQLDTLADLESRLSLAGRWCASMQQGRSCVFRVLSES